MSSSIPGPRDLPVSRYDLSTYWGRVRHAADISDPRYQNCFLHHLQHEDYYNATRAKSMLNLCRTLLTSTAQLQQARDLLAAYKHGQLRQMTPDLWRAKKVVDATLHPDTGEPVLLPFRMSCFVFSNLVVTAGMLTPGLGPVGTVSWQIANQSLNVAINSANANKSSPPSASELAKSYLLAVGASCSVALGLKALIPRLEGLSPATRTTLGRLVPFAAVASAGALNVFLMRGQEIRTGIDIFPFRGVDESERSEDQKSDRDATKDGLQNDSGKSIGMGIGNEAFGKELNQNNQNVKPGSTAESNSTSSSSSSSSSSSLGKSRTAAKIAVAETALSRVMNAMPVMVLPPLILVQLQRQQWLAKRPRLVLPVNLGLIFTTSILALPLALAVFPQRQTVQASTLEEKFWRTEGHKNSGDNDRMVEFNRGI